MAFTMAALSYLYCTPKLMNLAILANNLYAFLRFLPSFLRNSQFAMSHSHESYEQQGYSLNISIEKDSIED
jgi:hypothetical protein